MTSANPYTAAGLALLAETGVVVKRWRSNSSGTCWHDDRSIESPYPRGPISFAILAHEIAHALDPNAPGSRRRYVEEVEAWEYALNAVERYGLRGYERVEERAASSIGYAFRKAISRGRSASAIAEEFPSWWARVEFDVLADLERRGHALAR